MKLESTDPRCTTSTCLATVMAKFGPRLLLRLDGSGSSNDFWVSVDSSCIHPIGYTEKSGGMLQPPLGKLFCNVINGMKETLGKNPPKHPGTNKFEVGMKLEAIDPKEPRMICPSTIVQVKPDKVEVMFDGWKIRQWYAFDSKQLFPANWWQKIGVNVTPPPNKMRCVRGRCLPVYKKPTTPSIMPTTTYFDVAQCSSGGSRVNGLHQKLTCSEISTSVALKENNTSMKFSPHRSCPPTPSQRGSGRKSDLRMCCTHGLYRSDAVVVDLFGSKHRPNATSTFASESSPNHSTKYVSSPMLNGGSAAEQYVSTFAVNSDIEPNERDVMIGCDDSDATRKFCIYLNASCRLGSWLDPLKLCDAPRKFGPANLNHVMRMVIQTLLDCALDVRAVFSAIPRGEGYVTVTADLDGVAYVRYLPVWGRAETAWVYVSELCSLLGCCPNLISGEPVCKRCCGQKEVPREACFHSPPKKLRRICDKDPNSWSVDDVFLFVSSVVDEQSADLFRKQEIDGSALFLLSNDMMIKYLNVRLGPAVKIAGAIEKMKMNRKVVNLYA
ncbi:unnamed protein product [Soboliphyme baturini]|uniref:SAM domain-containing protein n=1 Tax=Soboliphyme baturini TaxID=241478 RepID=A0A183IM92_9BILA|nr:unnamed protein product [Soboliphyme baturini]